MPFFLIYFIKFAHAVHLDYLFGFLIIPQCCSRNVGTGVTVSPQWFREIENPDYDLGDDVRSKILFSIYVMSSLVNSIRKNKF